MAAKVIDGKKIAVEIRQEVARGVAKLQGTKPGLAAILVGDDPASQVYVGSKEEAANEAGMNSWVHRLEASASQASLNEMIESLNTDDRVHGILLQLPLPKSLDEQQALDLLDPSKDIDGLTVASAGLLALGRPRFVPCTPKGISVLLERSNTKTAGKHAVVIGRSNLVGRPISTLLSLKFSNSTVTLCHTGTIDLAHHTRDADILIVAAGQAGAIDGSMIKPGATVIDVGINRNQEGKLVGDVEFASASQVAGAITPVPGGVGPMTVAMLLSNTLESARSKS